MGTLSTDPKATGTVTAIATGNNFSAAIAKHVEPGRNPSVYTKMTTAGVVLNTDGTVKMDATTGQGRLLESDPNSTDETWTTFLESDPENNGYTKTVVKQPTYVLDGQRVTQTLTVYTSAKTSTIKELYTYSKIDKATNLPVAGNDPTAPIPKATFDNIANNAAANGWLWDQRVSQPTSQIVHNATYTLNDDTVSIIVTTTTTTYTKETNGQVEIYTCVLSTTPSTIYTRTDADVETDIYTLYTFGSNANFKLAQGLRTDPAVGGSAKYPLAVDLNTDDEGSSDASVIMVNAGAEHMITVKKDGYMWSAGYNASGQLGNVTRNTSNVMVMVGEQYVNVTPSLITLAKGQTIGISEIWTNRDKKLKVTAQAGINLLLRGNDKQADMGKNWKASTMNESILSVRTDQELRDYLQSTSYGHPDFNFTKAAAAEISGSEYRTNLDKRMEDIKLAFSSHNVPLMVNNNIDLSTLLSVPMPSGRTIVDEEALYLWAKMGNDNDDFKHLQNATNYATTLPGGMSATDLSGLINDLQTLFATGMGENVYVRDFIEKNKGSLVAGTGVAGGKTFYYNGMTLDPAAPQVPIRSDVDGFDNYFITGNALGQTMIRVKVPGLSIPAFVQVKVLAGINDKTNPMVAVGQTHTVALKSDGTVWTWGDNSNGQLGRETYDSMGMVIFPNMIEYVINNRDGGKNYFDRLDEANKKKGITTNYGTLITDYDSWVANGSDTGFLNEVGYPWDDPDPIVYVVAGANVSYAMSESGRIFAWGDNSYYQLAVGNLTDETGLAGITPGSSDVRLPRELIYPVTYKTESGEEITEVKHVGQNGGTLDVKSTYDAQTGNYLTTLYYTVTDKANNTEQVFAVGHGFTGARPTQISNSGMGSITQISADYALAGGQVWHFTTSEPEKISGFTLGTDGDEASQDLTITKIAVGADHVLALDELGGVWAWGSNEYGQLGIRTAEDDEKGDSAVPVRVEAGDQGVGRLGVGGPNGVVNSKVTDIAANQFSSYARTEDNKAWAWGRNDHGQLGLMPVPGTTAPEMVGYPKQVDRSSRGDHYINVYAGFFQSVNLDENGMLWAAGANDYDQLANGNAVDIYVPTLVGDSALEVTIANNYTDKEADKEIHLGEYIHIGKYTPQPVGAERYMLVNG
ncbi:MAG: hypothetical protein NC311_18560, partial [Muribaculaceae bacterium]|nr:hypothetical protein [Muribaculaceae bacterium]